MTNTAQIWLISPCSPVSDSVTVEMEWDQHDKCVYWDTYFYIVSILSLIFVQHLVDFVPYFVGQINFNYMI